MKKLALLLSLCLPGLHVAAQSENEGRVDEEILVIANTPTGVGKLDAALKDQPQNVTVITEEFLDSLGIPRIEDIAYATVGLQPVAPKHGTTNFGFFARGFNGATVVVDGYYSSNNAFGSVGIIDLATAERVEVLRGPAAILYGQGNPAGVINITSKMPRASLGADIDTSVNSYGVRRVETDVTGPLSAGINARMVVVYEDSDSFRDFITQERRLISPSLHSQVGDNLTFRLNYTRDDLYYVPDNGPGVNSDLIENLDPEANIGEPWQTETRAVNDDMRAETDWRFAEGWTARLGYYQHETEMPDPYFEIDADCTIGDPQCSGGGTGSTEINRAYILEKDGNEHSMATVQLLGRFNSGRVGHTLTAAVDSIDNSTNFDYEFGFINPINYKNPQYSSVPPPLTPAFSGEGAYESTVEASYVQDLLALSEEWKVLLGVRRDEIETVGFLDAAATMEFLRSRETKNTPRFGVVFSPTEILTWYASYSEAFSPLIGNDRNNRPFEPEDSSSVEFGLRAEIHNRMLLTAAVYDIEKENIIVVDPVDPNFNINAGVAHSRGFELELQGSVTDAWWINAGISYTDAFIKESADPAFPEGDELPGASEWMAVFNARYELGDLEIGGNIAYAGDREYVIPNTRRLDAYTRVDLLAMYEINDEFEVQLNLNNITDERILLANGYGRAQFDAPRMAALSLRYRLGSLN